MRRAAGGGSPGMVRAWFGQTGMALCHAHASAPDLAHQRGCGVKIRRPEGMWFDDRRHLTRSELGRAPVPEGPL